MSGSRFIRGLRCALFALALAGCESYVKNPTSLKEVRTAAAAETAAAQKYRIGPGDELEIVFFHTPDLNLTLPVRPDGGISVPLAHDVRAAGLTPEELRELLTQSFARELEKPEIAVVVRGFAGNRIHVGGEVGRPGIYPLQGYMSVLDALLGAGVHLRTARMDDIVVIRRADDSGGFKIIPLNLKKVLDGTDPTQNLALAPFDAVFAPMTPIAHVGNFTNQYIREAIPIDFQLRYNINNDNN
jgi:polysaccharide export outer membrane protein